ncbi:MAG: alpha/beta hydrolase [Acidobacteriota bacterium]
MRKVFLVVAFAFAMTGCMPTAPVVKTGTIDLPGTRLAYEQRGDAIHTMVLIHGGLVDRRVWDLQAEPLAAMTGRRVIRYDQRGFGQSTRTPGPYSPVDDLLSLVNTLNVDRAELVGLSVGGQIAIEFALAHPERVEKLVLVSSSVTGMPSNDDPALRPIWVNARQGNVDAAIDLWMQHPLFKADVADPLYDSMMRTMLRDNLATWSDGATYRDQQWGSPPAYGRLAEIHVPTLIIRGDHDVGDIVAVAEAMSHQIPGARLITFPASAHHLNVQHPADFNRAVASF